MSCNCLMKPWFIILNVVCAGIVYNLSGPNFFLYRTLFCSHEIKEDESVIIFPTFAYQDGEDWVLDLHGLIFEPERDNQLLQILTRVILEIFEWNLPSPEGKDREYFYDRFWYFLVDNEGCKSFEFALVNPSENFEDPQGIPRPRQLIFDLTNASQPNGHFFHFLRLNPFYLSHLFEDPSILSNQSLQINLEFQIKTQNGRIFSRKIPFLNPFGISVISDIDDTIKETGVKNKTKMLENTFFKKFKAIEGMAEVYKGYGANTAFHFVSGSPWQLFEPLSEFLHGEAGFPLASWHLKLVRWKEIRSLKELMGSQINFKLRYIIPIISAFPNRTFTLFGDSGEADPEVYMEVIKKFPCQIDHVYIRHFNENGDPDPEICSSRLASVDWKKWTVLVDPIDPKNLQNFCSKKN